MRISRRMTLMALPLLSTCGGADHGTLLVDNAARQAGAMVELVTPAGTSAAEPAKTLPYKLETGDSAIVEIGSRQVSVEPGRGTVITVSGPQLTVSKVEPSALELTSTEPAAHRLADAIGATVEKRGANDFILRDGPLDLVSRAAEAQPDAEITDLRPVPVDASTTAPTHLASVAVPAALPPTTVALATSAAPIAIPAAPPGFDASKRYLKFFGYCGSWLPAPGEPFEARFDDGSVATGQTDGLGLVVLDNAPNLHPQVMFEHGADLVPPRPYELDAAKPATFANVRTALQPTQTVDTLAWGLMDAGAMARSEWSDKVIGDLSHPHAGVWILAAIALLRYPTEVQDRGLASISDPHKRDLVAYVLGRPASHTPPAVVWSSAGIATR